MNAVITVLAIACAVSVACAGWCLHVFARLAKRSPVEKIRDAIVADYQAALGDVPGAPQLIQALANDLEHLARPVGLQALRAGLRHERAQPLAVLPSPRASLVSHEPPTVH